MDYKSMTDEELISLINKGDYEAKYYLDARQSNEYWNGVAKNCGKYTADIDYYGAII